MSPTQTEAATPQAHIFAGKPIKVPGFDCEGSFNAHTGSDLSSSNKLQHWRFFSYFRPESPANARVS